VLAGACSVTGGGGTSAGSSSLGTGPPPPAPPVPALDGSYAGGTSLLSPIPASADQFRCSGEVNGFGVGFDYGFQKIIYTIGLKHHISGPPRTWFNCLRPPPEGPRANGCGEAQGAANVPDRGQWFDFAPACERHDQCYGTLGPTQNWCDQNFLRDMLFDCGAPDSPVRPSYTLDQRAACQELARRYSEVVGKIGSHFINQPPAPSPTVRIEPISPEVSLAGGTASVSIKASITGGKPPARDYRFDFLNEEVICTVDGVSVSCPARRGSTSPAETVVTFVAAFDNPGKHVVGVVVRDESFFPPEMSAPDTLHAHTASDAAVLTVTTNR
jgi:hypothetical protein